MFGNVLRQQNILFKNNIRVILIFILIIPIFVFGNSSTINENNSMNAFNAISSTFFNRYLICFVFFPIQVMSLLSLLNYRIIDFYITQNRSVLAVQMLYKVSFATLTTNVIWIISVILVCLIKIPISLLMHIDISHFFLSFLLMMATSYMYLSLTAFLFLILKKVTAFLLFFIINLFTYFLEVNKITSLFYQFIYQTTFIKFIIDTFFLIGISLIIWGLIYLSIIRKEF